MQVTLEATAHILDIRGDRTYPAGVASRAVSHQMPSLGFALGVPTPYLVSGMHWSIRFPCCTCKLARGVAECRLKIPKLASVVLRTRS
jgi:hypothetical protein